MAKWKPGESGNPAGRPVGSKNRYSMLKESFLEAYEASGGTEGLVAWIRENPKNRTDFYRILAGMVPRDLHIEAIEHRRSAIEYSTDELITMLSEDEPTKRIQDIPTIDKLAKHLTPSQYPRGLRRKTVSNRYPRRY